VIAKEEDLSLRGVIASLAKTRRDVAYLLSILKAAEVGLDELMEGELLAKLEGNPDGLADISSWAHRASLAAESAADALMGQAADCSQLAGGPKMASPSCWSCLAVDSCPRVKFLETEVGKACRYGVSLDPRLWCPIRRCTRKSVAKCHRFLRLAARFQWLELEVSAAFRDK
jgi:hypothetical protein